MHTYSKNENGNFGAKKMAVVFSEKAFKVFKEKCVWTI